MASFQNIEHLTIKYVLGSSFPTVKAYGITCKETVREIIKKNAKVEIFCYPSQYTDSEFRFLEDKIVHFKTTQISRTLRAYGNRNSRSFHAFAWKLGLLFDLWSNLKQLKSPSSDIYWVRNTEIALFILKRTSNRVLMEIHAPIKKRTLKKLEHFRHRLVFLPINQYLANTLNSLSHDIYMEIAPMSINPDIVAGQGSLDKYLSQLPNKNLEGLRIGYIGKFFPMGHSKGIEDLISLAQVYREMELPHEIYLVGGTYSEIETLQARIQNHVNVRIVPHMNHKDAILMMQKMDVLILPAPRSTEYKGTPIKLLEYLASGRVVFVCQEALFEREFGGDFLPNWYSRTQIRQLAEKILVETMSRDLKLKLNQQVIYASQYTWQKRTSRALEKVLKIEAK